MPTSKLALTMLMTCYEDNDKRILRAEHVSITVETNRIKLNFKLNYPILA